jgi:acyl-CoA thioester hydrolase
MHIQFDTQIRVRYAEADRMGYVYNGNYAMYFEAARTEMLRSFGFSYREWEDNGIILPVRELHIRYHAPAFYDDLLTIRTIIKERPAARITFHHEVYNDKDDLICTGSLTLVFVNRENKRPIRAPDFFLKAIDEVSQSQSRLKS